MRDPADVLREMAYAQRVLEHLRDAEDCWTRERANADTGEHAFIARRVFKTYPNIHLVIVSRKPPEHRGLVVFTGQVTPVWYRWTGRRYAKGHVKRARTGYVRLKTDIGETPQWQQQLPPF